ncbi:hypothetical protein IEQ34_022348 [Dendrobium chrysotoxum]|uniref:Ubiquitin-like protease family profile domain-containing protein n=1 Tax=Dendrobium chrysotoxum TaxID=161865 RepID=A0AAV7FYS8_DENCH|nr:hypothetical protein IEQ34_022348 [Dendrobium chrysotoxum]
MKDEGLPVPAPSKRNYSIQIPDVELRPDANKIVTCDIHPSYLLSLLCFNILNNLRQGHVIPFTTDEVAFLTSIPNRGEEISWLTLPPTGVTSKDIKGDIIFSTRNIIIFRRGIDKLLSNSYLNNNHHYKVKDQNSKLFIDHINYNYVQLCKILIHPIIDGSHWTLVVGLVNERKWEFYDSVPNPMHRNISIKIIRSLYRDTEEAFDSDINKWRF